MRKNLANQTLHPTATRPRSCHSHRKFSRLIRCGRLPPAAVGELFVRSRKTSPWVQSRERVTICRRACELGPTGSSFERLTGENEDRLLEIWNEYFDNSE